MANAEEALTMLNEEKFDLVISDLRMAGMNGLELVCHIREFMPDLGVISSRTIKLNLQLKPLAGAFDFLCKPFQSEGLLIAVSRYCNYLELREKMHDCAMSAQC